MVQNLSVGQSSTSEIETWRCSGTSVSCRSADESQVFIHAESDRVVPNSNVALLVAESSSTQQSTVDRTHQPGIRPESVNPVILSSTAKLVVDSNSFDLKEGRFPQRGSCEHNQAQALRHQNCRRLDERRERDRDSAQDKIQRV